jgi:hypothetical protein
MDAHRINCSIVQLASLSKLVSLRAGSRREQAENEAHVNWLMARRPLCSQFSVVKGENRHIEDPQLGLNAFRSICSALHRRWDCPQGVKEAAKRGRLLLMPFGHKVKAGIEPVPEGESVHRKLGINWKALPAEFHNHTGCYFSGAGTAFFWEWKVVRGEKFGGTLELTGLMSSHFAQGLPKEAVVQEEQDTAVC